MNEPKKVDLQKVEIALRRKLEGILHGDRLSIRKGDGSVLTDPRLYDEAADDARRIDWKLSSRFEDELFVRPTLADKQLETTFIVDMSALMFFGTDTQEKRNTSISTVWSLALLLNGGSNKIAAAVAHNDDFSTKWFRPMSGQRHRLNIVSYLRSIPVEAAGGVDPVKLIVGAMRLLRRKRGGLIFIVSDFLSPDWKKALRKLLKRRHTVYCIRIIDRRELQLENVGVIPMEDPVTGNILDVDTSLKELREAFADAAEIQSDEIKRDIFGSDAEYVELKTDGNWAPDLVRQLQASSRKIHRRGRKVA